MGYKNSRLLVPNHKTIVISFTFPFLDTRYPLGRSPFDYFVEQKRLLTVFGFFDFDTDSKSLKRVHTIALIVSKVFFLYLGFVLQTLSLFVSDSLITTAMIMFLDSAYMNIIAKTCVLFIKKQKIQNLWRELDTDRDYRTKTANETK